MCLCPVAIGINMFAKCHLGEQLKSIKVDILPIIIFLKRLGVLMVYILTSTACRT